MYPPINVHPLSVDLPPRHPHPSEFPCTKGGSDKEPFPTLDETPPPLPLLLLPLRLLVKTTTTTTAAHNDNPTLPILSTAAAISLARTRTTRWGWGKWAHPPSPRSAPNLTMKKAVTFECFYEGLWRRQVIA